MAAARAEVPATQEDADPRLVIECRHIEGRRGPFDTTVVRSVRVPDAGVAKAGSARIAAGREGKAAFVVDVGEMAECLYPSGHEVRVKVGATMARGYGRCGGDPEIFVSVWVDRRKVDSREWFAGHCYEGPLLRYDFDPWHQRKCRVQEAKPVDVCVSFPDLRGFAVDRVEYPPAGAKRPALGEIEVVRGGTPVCAFARERLRAKWEAAFEAFHPAPKPASSGEDEEETVDDDELEAMSTSRFDLDNDGHEDVVLERAYESTYMDGNVLLVKLARPPGATWFLPCQLDPRRPAMKTCPPFSQDNDEAGLDVAARGETVRFRVRYTAVTPFRFERRTYLALTSRAEDTLDWVAILKPSPGRKFDTACAIRRVSPNY